MKKYIAPSLKVVKIDTNVILAGSEIGTGSYNGTQQTLGRGNRGTLSGWDDED